MALGMESFILERYKTFRNDVIAWFYSLHVMTLVIQIAVYQPEWRILRPFVSLVRLALFLSMLPFFGLTMCLVVAALPFICTWFIFILFFVVLPCAIPITSALVVAGCCYWVYRVCLGIPALIGDFYHHWSSCIVSVLHRTPLLMAVIGTIYHLQDLAITCLQFLGHVQTMCFSLIGCACHVIFNPIESLLLLMKRLQNLLWSIFIEAPRLQLIGAAKRLRSALTIPSSGLLRLVLGSYADVPREVLLLLLRDYLMNGPVHQVKNWFQENVEIPAVLTDMVTHSMSNMTLGVFDGEHLQDPNGGTSVHRCTRSAPHLRRSVNGLH